MQAVLEVLQPTGNPFSTYAYGKAAFPVAAPSSAPRS